MQDAWAFDSADASVHWGTADFDVQTFIDAVEGEF